jgi:hypothetical protein
MVRLKLDGFGETALAASGGFGQPMIRTAARYYLADRDSGRVAWKVPIFVRTDDCDDPSGTEVEFDEDTMTSLEEEARRQGIAPSRLVEHAVLYFLADLDCGRATRVFPAE